MRKSALESKRALIEKGVTKLKEMRKSALESKRALIEKGVTKLKEMKMSALDSSKKSKKGSIRKSVMSKKGSTVNCAKKLESKKKPTKRWKSLPESERRLN